MKKGTLLLLFSFALLWVTPFVNALTLSELRTEIRRNIRDTDAVRVRYSDDLILDYINEAQREIVNATWLADKTTSYVLSANTSYYNLPDDMIVINEVYFKDTGDQTIELDEKSQKSLYDSNPDWETDSGTPDQYWVSNSTNPSNTNTTNVRISYIPIPTSLTTGTVTVWYFNQVDDLASDTDIPFEARRILFPYHMAIAYQVTARIKLLERKADEATAYFSLFNNYLSNIKSNLGKMPNFNPNMTGR